MKVLIAGSSGLVGSALVSDLQEKGHEVFRLIRTTEDKLNTIVWNPEENEIDITKLEGFDVFINLAGENISSGRWNAQKKKRILDSRIDATKTLCAAIAKLQQPPNLLINASAVGFYGNRDSEYLNELSSNGSGFLADVCRRWEAATRVAQEKGVRVVMLRSGMILSSTGGALAKMSLPFKLGLGGKIGFGNQYMSWIALDDVLKVIDFVINNESIQGPVNVVSPNPVTNTDFTQTLGKAWHRPTFLSMPVLVTQLIFGEMANEMLLSSQRVVPEKLLKHGYQFKYPRLEDAIKAP